MRITVFTSNQPRHIGLATKLTTVADEVYCISECNTVFPGAVDDFFRKSETMQRYFSNVIEAERRIFGDISFSSPRVRTLSIKSGDLNKLSQYQLADALRSDVYIVFGSSYVKGWLIDHLVGNNAVNIHMGISPYYRGSSCNFWALYDRNPAYVGATVHRLSKGLDSGDMFFHCIPRMRSEETLFDFTMRSVEVAHDALVQRIASGELMSMSSTRQDRSQEVRYTRNLDFNDDVASEFMARDDVYDPFALVYPKLLNPVFGD